MRSFLSALISASEKAALIARECRRENGLFQMLIEEKHGEEKNASFEHDFKTLADVLIQETVRHDIGKTYPALAENIRGEESSSFTNTLGETLTVRVCESREDTARLLCQVLDNHRAAADLLSEQVHADTSKLADDLAADLDRLPEQGQGLLDMDDLGIWIDPIDSTSNYIKGDRVGDPGGDDPPYDEQMVRRGLGVVTVLIGVFSKTSGRPIVGVVNQPFAEYDKETKSWRGQVYWGVSVGDSTRFTSSSLIKGNGALKADKERKRVAVVGMTEKKEFIAKLEKKFDVKYAAGAGYKILCVSRGWVDFFATSKSSTFKWDSCAGHAILNALGGGCLDVVEIAQKSAETSLVYHGPHPGREGIEKWSNAGGVLAFRDRADLAECFDVIKGEQ